MWCAFVFESDASRPKRCLDGVYLSCVCVSLVQKCAGPSVCHVIMNKRPEASKMQASKVRASKKRQEEEMKVFLL